MDIVLFGFLVATAFAILRLRDLFAAAMMSGLFSLLSAGLFMVMDAVDVAFTEAAVGAGVSTLLMLATLSITRREEKRRRREVRTVPLLLALAAGGLLVLGTLDMPRFGDPDAPIHTHMAPRFLEDSIHEVGPPNIVTSVLASYRGYDTFGEATVIFAAAVGVLLLLCSAPGRDPADEAAATAAPADEPASRNSILQVSTQSLIPFILLFGLYVQFHGDYGPGGGFQAGVIFAAGVILFTLVYGMRAARRALPMNVLEILIAGGVLLYGSVGVVSMLLGGRFLDYDVLAHDAKEGQHIGILVIELGVGITVTAVMITLFFLFAGRGLRSPSRPDLEVLR
ncbi:MAG: DUF4040 domain-containing protein [Acidobacteriota bacterium]